MVEGRSCSRTTARPINAGRFAIMQTVEGRELWSECQREEDCLLRVSGDVIVETGQSSNVTRAREPTEEQLFQDCDL
jgi:hypothetical protein